MNRIIGYALAAIVIASTSFVASAEAADQIRIRLKNNAGFIISRVLLTKGGINGRLLGSNSKNFPIGKSQNVKWNVTSRYTRLDLYVNYNLWDDMHVQNCGKVASLKLDNSTYQITNVILPNGTELTTSNKLDNSKDQIVRLDFSVTGSYPGGTKCKYKRGRVYRR